ncbi:MAG: exonuclease domain-containing protein [Lachnospiraceae bacterium]|nr:exonuclease domain-containing protein [Lachnospiraceae bacterium]MDE7416995.1 exonuclease domain-containing protein [Lachnospiraceae bacterium]
MNYIIFDLEWNQAADLRTRRANSLLFEIIEIGAVKLNEKREKIDDFHELIKPQVFHTMNQVTGDLIHLKMEQLENCRSFPEVAEDFVRWCGKDYIFCTWGSLDLTELQKNMDYYHMTPVSEKTLRYYDIQKLFSIAFEDRKSRRTLQYAVDFLGIEKDVAFHRAYTDAYYTAEIVKKIKSDTVFRNYSFDTYRLPRNKSEEIKICFEDYSKYISREFSDKLTAMGDREVTSTQCFLCGARTRKKIPWFTSNGKHYYTVVNCARHGAIKGKIRLRRSENGRIYVVKTMKQIDSDGVQDILNKKNQIRQSRKERRHKKEGLV